MSVKDYVEQVRSKLTDEQLSEVGVVLKTIESEVLELNNSLAAANSESKDRKIKIRGLETKIEDFDIEKGNWEKEKTGFEEKLNDTTMSKENEDLKAFKTNILKSQRQKFILSFEEISKHENWESAKSLYNIPTEKDDKDKLKWDAITDEQMEININKFDEHSTLNLFGANNKPSPQARKGQAGNEDHVKPKSVAEAQANIDKFNQT